MHHSKVSCIILFVLLQAFFAGAQQKEWMIGPFVKQEKVNPCLQPKPTLFFDPVLKRKVGWEAQDVFNPAAVIRNHQLYLLYRAEDTVKKYAGTSRIGLAESKDGLHFKTNTDPVLYPMQD